MLVLDRIVFIQNDRGDMVNVSKLSDQERFKIQHSGLLEDLDKVFDMVEFIGHDSCIETCIDIMRARGLSEAEIGEIISLIEYRRES